MYTKTRTKNICKEGKSYRFRKMINGRKVSKNFTKFKEALTFKKTINGTV